MLHIIGLNKTKLPTCRATLRGRRACGQAGRDAIAAPFKEMKQRGWNVRRCFSWRAAEKFQPLIGSCHDVGRRFKNEEALKWTGWYQRASAIRAGTSQNEAPSILHERFLQQFWGVCVFARSPPRRRGVSSIPVSFAVPPSARLAICLVTAMKFSTHKWNCAKALFPY